VAGAVPVAASVEEWEPSATAVKSGRVAVVETPTYRGLADVFTVLFPEIATGFKVPFALPPTYRLAFWTPVAVVLIARTSVPSQPMATVPMGVGTAVPAAYCVPEVLPPVMLTLRAPPVLLRAVLPDWMLTG
jgi:hypothetical protein